MIIESLLDTDLYKYTMMQVVLHQFPGAMVEYRFKCRSQGVDLKPYADEIREEILHYCSLRFQEDELAYLNNLSFFKSDFVQFLRLFKASPDYIQIDTSGEELDVIIKGPWLHTIVFEVPVLAIISEVYFRNHHPEPDYEEGDKRIQQKVDLVKAKATPGEFKFSDFGSRRRFSRSWHRHVVQRFSQELPEFMMGSSNVLYAKEFGIKPIGTMAHEYIQACQSLGPRLLYSQKFAFEKWAQEYRGDLGIALSDTYSLDAFLHDFDLYFCKLFDGARQDSGDPFAWGERLIQHYQDMKVDPKTKTFVFSDSLNLEKALAIYERFKGRCQTAFGIGTNLTNDVAYKAVDMVIKMVECNGQPVAKVSDEPGKTMCRDASYLKYLREVFHID